MTKYVIDSSSLIQLENQYPKDIEVFSPLYEKIHQMFENGELFSVKEVFEELRDSQELWMDYKEYFRELTDKEFENVGEIMGCDDFEVFVQWGMSENDGFWADPHLIACAMEDSEITIISEESSINNPKEKFLMCAVKKEFAASNY